MSNNGPLGYEADSSGHPRAPRDIRESSWPGLRLQTNARPGRSVTDAGEVAFSPRKATSRRYHGILERVSDFGVLLHSAFTVDDNEAILVFTKRIFYRAWITGVCVCVVASPPPPSPSAAELVVRDLPSLPRGTIFNERKVIEAAGFPLPKWDLERVVLAAKLLHTHPAPPLINGGAVCPRPLHDPGGAGGGAQCAVAGLPQQQADALHSPNRDTAHPSLPAREGPCALLCGPA